MLKWNLSWCVMIATVCWLEPTTIAQQSQSTQATERTQQKQSVPSKAVSPQLTTKQLPNLQQQQTAQPLPTVQQQQTTSQQPVSQLPTVQQQPTTSQQPVQQLPTVQQQQPAQRLPSLPQPASQQLGKRFPSLQQQQQPVRQLPDAAQQNRTIQKPAKRLPSIQSQQPRIQQPNILNPNIQQPISRQQPASSVPVLDAHPPLSGATPPVKTSPTLSPPTRNSAPLRSVGQPVPMRLPPAKARVPSLSPRRKKDISNKPAIMFKTEICEFSAGPQATELEKFFDKLSVKSTTKLRYVELSPLEKSQLIRAMKMGSDFRVLAAPSLMTHNNTVASLMTGGEIPFYSQTKDDTRKVTFIPFGINIELTPKLDSDRNLTIEMTYSNSRVADLKNLTGETVFTPTIKKGKVTGYKPIEVTKMREPNLPLMYVKQLDINLDVPSDSNSTFAFLSKGGSMNGTYNLVLLTPAVLKTSDFQRQNIFSNLEKKLSSLNHQTRQPLPTVANSQTLRQSPNRSIVPQVRKKPESKKLAVQIKPPAGSIIDYGGRSKISDPEQASNNVRSTFEYSLAGELIHKFRVAFDSKKQSVPSLDIVVQATAEKEVLDRVKLTLELTRNQIDEIYSEFKNGKTEVGRTYFIPNVKDETSLPKSGELFTTYQELRGKRLDGQFKEIPGLEVCHVLFIPTSSKIKVKGVTKMLQHLPAGEFGPGAALSNVEFKKGELVDALVTTPQGFIVAIENQMIENCVSNEDGSYECEMFLNVRAMREKGIQYHEDIQLFVTRPRTPIQRASYQQSVAPNPFANVDNIQPAQVAGEIESLRSEIQSMNADVQKIIELLEKE